MVLDLVKKIDAQTSIREYTLATLWVFEGHVINVLDVSESNSGEASMIWLVGSGMLFLGLVRAWERYLNPLRKGREVAPGVFVRRDGDHTNTYTPKDPASVADWTRAFRPLNLRPRHYWNIRPATPEEGRLLAQRFASAERAYQSVDRPRNW